MSDGNITTDVAEWPDERIDQLIREFVDGLGRQPKGSAQFKQWERYQATLLSLERRA